MGPTVLVAAAHADAVPLCDCTVRLLFRMFSRRFVVLAVVMALLAVVAVQAKVHHKKQPGQRTKQHQQTSMHRCD